MSFINDMTVERRNVYGKPTYYPACSVSQGFANIAGTKTLTPDVLDLIKNMGIAIDIIEQGAQTW